MAKPTDEQMARFRRRVTKDLAYYRGCLARIEDHQELHVRIDALIRQLEALDGCLERKPIVFSRDQLSALGWDATLVETMRRDKRAGHSSPSTMPNTQRSP